MTQSSRSNQNWYKRLPIKLSSSAWKGLTQTSLAILITFIIVILIAVIESGFKKADKNKDNQVVQSQGVKQTKIQNNEDSCQYRWVLFCLLGDSKLLGQVQNVSVIAVAILYGLEIVDRKKQLLRQAWQLIDGAKSCETSGARYQAIEDLYEEDKHNLLKGIDLECADLRGINLKDANLERANFENADLQGANLENANLKRANLKGTKLGGAILRGTILWGANLEKADLNPLFTDILDKDTTKEDCKGTAQKSPKTDLYDVELGNANLNRADLSNVNFGGKANLSGASLRGANLKDVDLKGVNISRAKLRGVLNLTRQQVENEETWKQALYDPSFIVENPDNGLEEDKTEESLAQKKVSNIIREIKKDNTTQQKTVSEVLIEFLEYLELLANEGKDVSPSTQEIANLRDRVVDVNRSIDKLYKNTEEGHQAAINAEEKRKTIQEDTRKVDERERRLQEEAERLKRLRESTKKEDET